ncbi:MAG: hypothetical protein RLZZ449_327 [Actinomycetota bacterium]
MARTLIKNGTVVSPTGRHEVDVLIEGDTISALLERGKAEALNITADKVIDAKGKYVVPGGIDVHTHMELPFGGTFASDTFETGTTAAAWGGVTTIVDFAVQRYGENVQKSLAEWHAKAAGNCSIDYAFHQIIGGIDDQALADMDYLVKNEGVTSFKLFMAYPGVFYSDDGQILRAMQQAGNNGSTIMMPKTASRSTCSCSNTSRVVRPTRSTTATRAQASSRERRRTVRSCCRRWLETFRCTSCTCRHPRHSTRLPKRATRA